MMFPYGNMNWGMGWGGIPWMMSPWTGAIFSVLIIWDVIWKGIGLWKAGRNNQLGWFIAILIVNSLGILPIIYLVWFQKKQEQTIIIPKAEPKQIGKKKVVKKK